MRPLHKSDFRFNHGKTSEDKVMTVNPRLGVIKDEERFPQIWSSSGETDKEDNLGNLQDQLNPIHKSDFRLHHSKTSEDKVMTVSPRLYVIKDEERFPQIWSSSGETDKEDNLGNLEDQLNPMHKSDFRLHHGKPKEDEAMTVNPRLGVIKDEERFPQIWSSSGETDKGDNLGNLEDQLNPIHKSDFRLHHGKPKEDEAMTVNPRLGVIKNEERFPQIWSSSGETDKGDKLKNFQIQMRPIHKSDFRLHHGKPTEDEAMTVNPRFAVVRDEKRFPQTWSFHPRAGDGNFFNFKSGIEDLKEKHMARFPQTWSNSKGIGKQDKLEMFQKQLGPIQKAHFHIYHNTAGKEEAINITPKTKDIKDKNEDRLTQTLSSLHITGQKDELKDFEDQVESKHESHFPLYHKTVRKEEAINLKPKIKVAKEKHSGRFSQTWSTSRKIDKADHLGNYEDQIERKHESHFHFDGNRALENANYDNGEPETEETPLKQEIAGGELNFTNTDEKPNVSVETVNAAPRKNGKEESGFYVSKSVESVPSDFVKLTKNMDKSRYDVKNDLSQDHFDEEKVHVTDLHASMAEGPLKHFASPSVAPTKHRIMHHEILTAPIRRHPKSSRQRPDFDELYEKINHIYNRLKDLYEEQFERQRNMSLGAQKENKELRNGTTSRRGEGAIPRPSKMKAQPRISTSRIENLNLTQPSEKLSSAEGRAKKMNVTEQHSPRNFSWSHTLAADRNTDTIFQYLKNISKRLQELHDKRLETPTHKRKHGGNSKESNHVLKTGHANTTERAYKLKNQEKKTGKYDRKTSVEDSVLKEMKQIYSNMKEIYQQQMELRKKLRLTPSREHDHEVERSFIPQGVKVGKFNRVITPLSSGQKYRESVVQNHSSIAGASKSRGEPHVIGTG